MNAFLPADILMPKTDHMEKWAVIACDQFTSDQAYWDRVRKNAEGAVSTINLILPEAELGTEKEAEHTAEINATMKKYMEDGVFTVYPNSYVYVERTLENGSIREGLVGMVDLDAYDYNPGATSAIRATERTVPERIPPRQRVRRDAPIELPHVLMLCDDHDKKLIEPIAAKKDSLKKIYDFDLMEDGGHITGWLVEGKDVEDFNKALTEYSATVGEKYTGLKGTPMVFAVGDGNHSLATAKSCYEELKKNNPGVDLSNHPARYALVELENIHDPAQVFEPIHRVIFKTEPKKLLKALEDACGGTEGFPVKWYIGEESGTIVLDKNKGELAVGILQHFLDEYLKSNPGEIDYIHDDDALISFAKQENAIGFLLPAMEKSQLFRGVIADSFEHIDFFAGGFDFFTVLVLEQDGKIGVSRNGRKFLLSKSARFEHIMRGVRPRGKVGFTGQRKNFEALETRRSRVIEFFFQIGRVPRGGANVFALALYAQRKRGRKIQKHMRIEARRIFDLYARPRQNSFYYVEHIGL